MRTYAASITEHEAIIDYLADYYLMTVQEFLDHCLRSGVEGAEATATDWWRPAKPADEPDADPDDLPF